jgi:hypothetical protein
VSNRQEDDWSDDAVALFQGARKAHDPTPSERARLDAVFERIQAGNATTSRAPEVAGRGIATYAMLRQVAKVSLAVVGIATAAVVFISVNRHPSEPARSALPAPSAVSSSPPAVAMLPAPVPSEARDGAPHITVVERESRPRSQRRLPRANARNRRPSSDATDVAEASVSAPGDGRSSVSAPPSAVTQHARSQAAVNAAAATRGTARAKAVELSEQAAVTPAARSAEPAPRTTSLEANERAPVSPAEHGAEPAPSHNAPSELALLKRMQAALREADFSKALALCAEHARRWPRGIFELEREGVRAIASCGANSDDAAQRAKRFLTAHPHASVAMRVSTACAAPLQSAQRH